ncbi:hypothetical protein TraAM80_05029 [Trypanosoma rangeli]|uniref:Uncharacterized protein n=1 Tax=Trypanosoma rangeli TaxID=5698 RepID=A0A3R7MFI4_TRYRA|nr:uncharacterized protein TraAM80_05029 [Trypanosoma rangeli]RNF04891.1 hypothetical protein TraAM80_05029 [Trypanosoma rangeli]|eukprot:RNF04891.1 hypothetical protein TraAM80_05029 [Trypanosoma rangeli]
MSCQAFSEQRASSADRVSRLSQRLRSGAIAMSRSAITQTDLLVDRIVDVGEGGAANFFEQLLARLEQHGVRRCREGDEAATNLDSGNSPHETPAVGHRSVDASLQLAAAVAHGAEDARAPYYYMCVPCEVRLTATATTAATLAMLEDAHHHCSSAEHRRIASWMGEPDIDCTLQNALEMDPTGYARIHVNGVPMLLSRRPGGGDMFFPLPHEVQDHERTAPAGMDGRLFATQPQTEVWHHPLRSVYTGARQLLYRDDDFRPRRKNKGKQHQRLRCHFNVHHIPMDSYEAESFLGGPTVPAIFEVTRQRLPKVSKEGGVEDGGYRSEYVVSDKPCMVWSDSMQTELSSLVVRHDGMYRIALLRASEATRWLSEAPPTDGSSQGHDAGGESHSQVLTVEALSQVCAAPTFNRVFKDLNTSGVGSSDAFTRSDVSSEASS